MVMLDTGIMAILGKDTAVIWDTPMVVMYRKVMDMAEMAYSTVIILASVCSLISHRMLVQAPAQHRTFHRLPSSHLWSRWPLNSDDVMLPTTISVLMQSRLVTHDQHPSY
jgi:hypothetical protein